MNQVGQVRRRPLPYRDQARGKSKSLMLLQTQCVKLHFIIMAIAALIPAIHDPRGHCLPEPIYGYTSPLCERNKLRCYSQRARDISVKPGLIAPSRTDFVVFSIGTCVPRWQRLDFPRWRSPFARVTTASRGQRDLPYGSH